MPHTKKLYTCLVCKSDFLGESRNDPKRMPKYCSRECLYIRLQDKITINCRICDSPFTTKKCFGGVRFFCSKKCYGVSRTKPKTKKVRVIKRVSLNCQSCGSVISTTIGRAERAKYCSISCAKNRKVKMQCKSCGLDYYRSPSQAGKSNYCSLKCTGASQSLRKQHRPILHCSQCGKSYRKAASAAKVSSFCSKKCKDISACTSIVIACEFCQKSFPAIRSRASDTRFCSRKCYWKFSGESGLEKRVKQALDSLGISFISQYKVGRFFIDFFLPPYSVALEADGWFWHSSEQAKQKDARRDEILAQKGIQTIRLSESQIRVPERLIQVIKLKLHL